MDLFGIGSSELIVLLLLAGVVLGPRRLARLARDTGKLLRQIQGMTSDLTKQLNREIDLLEAAEGKPGSSSPQAKADREAALPEAYRRFRQDFPDEGKLDNVSRGSTRGNRQPSQEQPPVAMPTAAPTGETQQENVTPGEPKSARAV
jgi:sec-independent protein translocase protein TatB